MANIKVPVFGGLVTYADPEDLDDLYTPETKNFDISKAGVLRRRESSSNFSSLTDRGINSLYNWVSTKLAGGSQWLLYCNRRGIIYRMDGSLSDVKTDGFNHYTNMFGANYQHELPTPLPRTISFIPLGDQILVNMGTEQDSMIFHNFDSKYFNGLLQPGSGAYIDKFYQTHPDISFTATGDNISGSLPEGSYIYNIAPVFDGVNEYPMDESIDKQADISSGSSNGKVTISIDLPMETQSKRLTNLKIYRSINSESSRKSYRQIKNINLLNFGNTDTGVNATGVMNRYALHTESVLPTQSELYSAFNSKYSTSYSQSGSGDYRFGWMLFDTISQADYSLDEDKYTKIVKDGKIAYIGGVDRYNNFAGNPSNMAQARTYSTHITANTIPFYETINNTNQDSFTFARTSDHILRNIGVYEDYTTRSDDTDPPAVDGSTFRGNGWTKKTNGDIVLAVVSWDMQTISWSGGAGNDGVRSNILKHEYIILPKTHMGENHIFFDDDTFNSIDNLVGASVDLNYTNSSNTSVSFSDTISSNTRQVLTIAPQSDDSINDDMINASRKTGSDSRNGYGIMMNQSITADVNGDVDYTYNISTQVGTLVYKDVGAVDGSLPTNPPGTMHNSRWKYAEQHGGRLFVANVVLDPHGENEKHSDMMLYSEAGMFGVIPIGNYIRLRDPQGGEITGIKSLGDSLAVLMEYGIYRLRVPSVNPSTFSILEANEYEGCIAPGSVCKVSDSIYFCGTNNIYKIDGMFNVVAIGSVIQDKWRLESDKQKTISEYDPIKGCLLFRFGSEKHTIHEYNIERDEWNIIVMENPVSALGLGMTNHVYTIDNSNLTATRSDNGHNPADPSPDDNPNTNITDHLASANNETTTGNYWSAIIGVGQSWGSVLSDDPIIAVDHGEEDVITPPAIPGDAPTVVTYRKFKVFKQTTTASFRFGNWSDGTSVYLPVKNEDRPMGARHTWFYWDTANGEPLINQVSGIAVDVLDENQNVSHALVSIGITNSNVDKDGNGMYFYNGERDFVTSENDGLAGGMPADTFHQASVIFNTLRGSGHSKWYLNNVNDTIQFPTTQNHVNYGKYEVSPEAFYLATNTSNQHGWVHNDDYSSNYFFILPEVDNSVIPWYSQSQIDFFESTGVDYTQPLLTGKMYLPIWFDGGISNVGIVDSNITSFSEAQWSEVRHKQFTNPNGSLSVRDVRFGIPQSMIYNYPSGDLNTWINDSSLAFWEKLILVKANSNTSKCYYQEAFVNPFSSATPRAYGVWYNILRAQRLTELTWE